MEMGKPGLPFEGLISNLRKQEFMIGVDHYLRLQELLNKLGPGCEPSGLKYLLCPIFAVNERQQQQFYRAFDLYFKPMEAAVDLKKKFPTRKFVKRGTSASPDESITPSKWPYVLWGIMMVILTIVFIFLLGGDTSKENETQGTEVKSQGVKVGIDITVGGTGEKNLEQPDWIIWINFFLHKYKYIFRWIGILAPFIILLLIEGYSSKRRRLLLLKQRDKKPPLVWPIKVESPETGFIKNDWFYRAAQFLRKRIKSDIIGLDLEKTISGTIENGGFPAVRYKTVTRPPEYLILIDLPNYRDHYAHLWNDLVTTLAGEGVYVTRYFYEQDPRVCFKEPAGQREYLSVLKSRYSDHRLIICGDGEGFLEPLTGELDKWTGLFKTWQERALLTTRRPREWSWKEIALAGDFVVVPATNEGLCALEDHWEQPTEPGLKTWKQVDEKLPFLPRGREEQVEELRKYLGQDTFQWLCACAVYPELHWDLTLYLGTLPCMPENLLNEENVLHLLRLPWFRTGAIPDELRWELINQLDTGKSRIIRTAIVEVLEKNPAPTDSFAYESYRLYLAVQRWILSLADWQKSKAALKPLKSAAEKDIVKDYTMLRFLEADPTPPLHLVIPKRLRKLFYRKGVPLFGIKTGIRMALTVLIAITLFLFIKETSRDVLPDDVRAVIEKAERVYQNEKGFWEAYYGDGITMVYIPPGKFWMGQTEEEKKWVIDQTNENDYYKFYRNECPLHEVYLDGYWIGKYEVTFAQYDKYCEVTGKKKPDDREWGRGDRPVIYVSWYEAVAYCQWFSGKTGLKFKLPTEAQWEKAARGTDSRKYPWGNSMLTGNKANFADKQLWIQRKYSWADKEMDDGYAYIAPVGSYQEGISPYGLLDMSGNVWEWCNDWYDVDYYTKSLAKNPQGPDSGSDRVIRSGGWRYDARYLRCAYRFYYAPNNHGDSMGFRLCQENDLIKSGIVETQIGSEYSENMDSRRFMDADPIVYITKTSKKYHRAECSFLRKIRIKIRLSEAKRRGYTPCSRCKPLM